MTQPISIVHPGGGRENMYNQNDVINKRTDCHSILCARNILMTMQIGERTIYSIHFHLNKREKKKKKKSFEAFFSMLA